MMAELNVLHSAQFVAAREETVFHAARRADFLVGQAVRLSPPAVAGVWLWLCCSVGQPTLAAAAF
jgi:hypothetical protein